MMMRSAGSDREGKRPGAAPRRHTRIIPFLAAAGSTASLLSCAALLIAAPPAATPAAAHPAEKQDEKNKENQATALLRRMVEAEIKHAFLAREATLTADGRGTEQWVKRDPRRGLRRESIRPPGTVWIDNYKHAYRLNLRDNTVIESESMLPRPEGQRVKDFFRRRFKGQLLLKAEVVGEDRVAGRTADIVAITGPATTRRFWIDRGTGLRLKTEEYNKDGRLLSSSYYASLDLKPRFSDDDFRPPADARLIREARRRFPNLPAAEKAGVRVRTPRWVPEGYTLRVVEVLRDGETTALRYSNSIDAFSLSQFNPGKVPDRLKKHLNEDGDSGSFLPFPRGQRGYVWRDGGTTFLLISTLSDEQVKRLAESIK